MVWSGPIISMAAMLDIDILRILYALLTLFLTAQMFLYCLDHLRTRTAWMRTFHDQCPKLRVHPAPHAHIFTAGCTIFGGVHPMCARFLSQLYSYISRGCMEKLPARQG